MPISKYDRYFGGNARKARAAMHTQYGAEAGERVFYATKNKRKAARSRMPKGATLSPQGDIGRLRQEESVRVGGFPDGECVKTKFGGLTWPRR